MIPKKIHQIWIGGEMPTIIKYYTSTFLKLKDEGYEYKLWGNDDLTETNFPKTYTTINNLLKRKKILYAQIADIMRLEILYHHGGIYVDSTMEYIGNIDYIPIDKYPFILSNERSCGLDCVGKYDKKFISNSFIASIPKYIVLERLLTEKNMKDILANYNNYPINVLSGPYFLRTGIKDKSEVKVLDINLIYPFNYEDENNMDKCLSYDEKIGFDKEYYFDNVFYIKKPCDEYKDSVMIKHWDVGGTWINKERNMFDDLNEIINIKSENPVIINPESKFVFITYWWGKGNLNKNIAKPCSSYYDKVINRFLQGLESTLIELKKLVREVNKENIDIDNIYFLKQIKECVVEHRNLLCDWLEINHKESDKKIIEVANEKLNYIYDKKIIKYFIKLSFEELIHQNIQIIKNIFVEKDIFKENFKVIKLSFKQKMFNFTFFKKYNGLSLNEILINELSFVKPITYDVMIEKWKEKCEKSEVNYLAIEYPEFARKGGYQLAINAKPFFIKKALQLCKDRSVVYIDGDMTVNQYPHIFDTNNVDFMARGWNIDPRSSYKFNTSITYDPYTFETSGGIMYFSQSKYSKKLLDFWIRETVKPINIGKADDRILSLIFNTYRCLCEMTIIQLPIEYLWLSQDYDERMLENFYDWDKNEMKNNIYIEHPECLTDEDMAHTLGASNIREPEYYKIITDIVSSISEDFYEYIMYSNEKTINITLHAYMNYLYNAIYFDMTDKDLIEKGFVDVENPDNNERLLNIIKFKNQYGKRNNIYKRNLELLEENKDEIKKFTLSDNLYIINTKVCKDELISLILLAFKEKKGILYIPTKYNELCLKEIKSDKFIDLDLVFSPILPVKYQFNEFYKPKINLDEPIIFRYSEILEKILYMFSDLRDFSDCLNRGNYHFFSRIRIGYVFCEFKSNIPPLPVATDGGKINNDVDNYLYFLENKEEIDGKRKKIILIRKRKLI